MATAIGDLVMRLGAQTNQFDKKMNGARRQMGMLGRASEMVTGRLRGMFGMFAGAATIGGLTMAIRSQFQMVDATAKLSKSLGMSTEFLSAMGFAAEQSGMSVGGLNEAMLRMNRRVGMAANGSGLAAAAIQRLGLSAQSLAGAGAEEQFRTIAQRISQIPDATTRAVAAFEIFGRSGQQLLPMLEGGAAGLDKFVAEAKRLGITLSALDTKEIQAANDAINRMKRAMGGVVRQLAIKMAPAVKQVAGYMLLFLQRGKDGFLDLMERVARTVAWLGKMAVGFVAVKAALWLVNAAITVYAARTKIAAAAAAFLQALMGPAGMAKVALGLAVATAAIVTMEHALNRTSLAAERAGRNVSSMRPGGPRLPGVECDIPDSPMGLAPNPQIERMEHNVNNLYGKTVTPFQKWVSDLKKLNEIWKETNWLNIGQYNAIAAKLREEFDQNLGGPKARIRELTDQWQLMTGQVSAATLELRRFAAAGVKLPTLNRLADALGKIEGAKCARQFETPLERARQMLKRAKQLHLEGKISFDTMWRASQAVRRQEQSQEQAKLALGQKGAGGAAMKGSREAFSRVVTATQSGKNKAEERIANATEKSAKSNSAMEAWLQDIASRENDVFGIPPA